MTRTFFGRRISGIIWDMDGTVLDSMHVWKMAMPDYLKSIGIVPSEVLYKQLENLYMRDAVVFCKRIYDISESTEGIVKKLERYLEEAYRQTVLPKANATAFLAAMQAENVPMCLATATDRPLVEAALKRNGLAEYFQQIFTCSELRTSKSKPDIFRTAQAYMGTPKDSTWVFEDAVYAAKTAKADGFCVAGIYDRWEPEPEALKNCSDVYLKNYGEALLGLK